MFLCICVHGSTKDRSLEQTKGSWKVVKNGKIQQIPVQAKIEELSNQKNEMHLMGAVKVNHNSEVVGLELHNEI